MVLPELTTERLWLRPLRVADASDLHVAYRDPECLRFWHHPPSRSVTDTGREVRHLVDHEQHWAFGRTGDPSVVGHVGFVDRLEPRQRAGFGYLVRAAAWGDGLAVEAGRAALDHAFEVVGIAVAELWIQAENRRSIRVAEKLGATHRGHALVHGAPHVIHGVTAAGRRAEVEPSPLHYGVEPIVAVSDVAAAVTWWVEVVGFRVGFVYGDPPTHAGVLPADAWTGGPRVQLTSRPAAAGVSMVYVTAGDVDGLAARARRAGATVLTPLGDRPWGVREIELADPDGNRIRLGAG